MEEDLLCAIAEDVKQIKEEEAKQGKQKGEGELTLLRILDILQEYSDETHPLSQEKIVQLLKKDYGLDSNRKRVAEKVELLIRADYGIEQVSRKGYFFAGRTTDAELHFLADSVITNRYITKAETESLVRRIMGIAGVDFDKRIKHLAMLDEMNKDERSEFFKNIELVDQARMQEKRLSFYYYHYDHNKKLQRGSLFEVSPYQLILHNQRYYLMVKDERWGNIAFYRVDRIRDMRILPKGISDIRSVPGYNGGISYSVISALPYLYPDEQKTITFRAAGRLVDQLVDWFGLKNVKIDKLKSDASQIEGSVFTSPMAIELWAKQNAPAFEVLAPKDIREKIRTDLAAAMAKYNS